MLEVKQRDGWPLVSLIIPVYNSGLYLDELFRSLFSQTYENLEIICINDGSRDNSLELLRGYETLDKRVVVVDKPNSGAAATRNAGIERATGEYLCFVDSDDFIESNSIELLVNAAITNQADAVVFDIDYYDDETKTFSPHFGAVSRYSIPIGRPFKASEVKHFYKYVIGYTVNKLYRTDFLKGIDLRFPEIGAHEDMPFTYIALSAADRIFYLGDTLYHYRRSREGSLSDGTNDQYHFMIQALVCFRTMLIDRGLWECNRLNYLNYAVHMCLWKNNDIRYKLAKQFRRDCRDIFFSELGLWDFPEELIYDDDERIFFRRVRNGVEWPFALRRVRNFASYLLHAPGRVKNIFCR